MSEPACCRGDSRESVIGAHMGTEAVVRFIGEPPTFDYVEHFDTEPQQHEPGTVPGCPLEQCRDLHR